MDKWKPRVDGRMNRGINGGEMKFNLIYITCTKMEGGQGGK